MMYVNLLMVPPELDGPSGDHLATVLTHVANERPRQDRKWGGPAHDDRHTPEQWGDLIVRLLDEAEEAHAADRPSRYRHHLVEVAASAVAAIQSHDRLQAPGESGEVVHAEPAPRGEVPTNDITGRVISLITCQRLPAPVTAATRLVEDLGFDTLALVNLEIAIEHAFGLPEESTSLRCDATVADVIALVTALEPAPDPAPRADCECHGTSGCAGAAS